MPRKRPRWQLFIKKHIIMPYMMATDRKVHNKMVNLPEYIKDRREITS